MTKLLEQRIRLSLTSRANPHSLDRRLQAQMLLKTRHQVQILLRGCLLSGVNQIQMILVKGETHSLLTKTDPHRCKQVVELSLMKNSTNADLLTTTCGF